MGAVRIFVLAMLGCAMATSSVATTTIDSADQLTASASLNFEQVQVSGVTGSVPVDSASLGNMQASLAGPELTLQSREHFVAKTHTEVDVTREMDTWLMVITGMGLIAFQLLRNHRSLDAGVSMFEQ